MAPTAARSVNHLFGSLNSRRMQEGETNRAVLGELSGATINQGNTRSSGKRLHDEHKVDATLTNKDLKKWKKRSLDSNDVPASGCLPCKRHRGHDGNLPASSLATAEPTRSGSTHSKSSRICQSFDRLLSREMGVSYGFRSHEPISAICMCPTVGIEALSDLSSTADG